MRPPMLMLLMLSLIAGCTRFFPAPTPMRAIDYPSSSSTSSTSPAACLVVFLPGMGDSAAAFEKNGFVEALRQRNLAVDIVAAQATIGYYSRGTVVERLWHDVIEPRRRRPYAQTWLIGPSMGGFGTLFYSRRRPGEITGVLALAPFLGERDLAEEIASAGGLRRWPAPARVAIPDDSNYQRELWRWLQAATAGHEPAPIIHLGFGRQDHLAFAGELLAAVLPKDRVYRVDGGHTWDVWRVLLTQFLDQGEFAKSCR